MSNSNNHKLIPLFAIQDVVSNFYPVPPFCNYSMGTDAAGMRYFVGYLKDNFAAFSWYDPADYRLFRVGSFDMDNGHISYEDPELLLDGASLDISDWERGVPTK